MTHRTDDMSQLPNELPASTLTQQKSLEAPTRPKIRMVGAPPPPSNPLHPPPDPTAPPAPPLDPDVDATAPAGEATQQQQQQHHQQAASSDKPPGTHTTSLAGWILSLAFKLAAAAASTGASQSYFAVCQPFTAITQKCKILACFCIA